MTDLSPSSPTVVLVHGAFADAGSWAAVVDLLLGADVKVQALAIPMRGLATDSAYVASAISQIEGPVLAVGHSYGGAVISNACTDAANVVGLVFVNGFATELGSGAAKFGRCDVDRDLGTLTRSTRSAGDAEIHDRRLVFRTDHDVGGFQVAMDDARFVGSDEA